MDIEFHKQTTWHIEYPIRVCYEESKSYRSLFFSLFNTISRPNIGILAQLFRSIEHFQNTNIYRLL